jgi:hypothetical protein
MKYVLTLLACVFLFTGYASATDLMAGPSTWQIRFSPGMPAHPSASGSGWAFDFPQGNPCDDETCLAVHYVTRPYGKTITDGATLTATFRVDASGAPTFGYKTQKENTCVAPATVRFILQKKNDDFYAANGRFWSNPVSTQLTGRRYDREA